MKFIALALALTVSGQLYAQEIDAEYANDCRTVEVKVDQIVKNDHISGHVSGLTAAMTKNYKVVLYVKTNRWYIHPYSSEGDGYSYSSLNEKGEFKLPTVLRTPSNYLAAVLFRKNVVKFPQYFRLHPFFGHGGVTKYSCAYTVVPGNGDFIVDSASVE